MEFAQFDADLGTKEGRRKFLKTLWQYMDCLDPDALFSSRRVRIAQSHETAPNIGIHEDDDLGALPAHRDNLKESLNTLLNVMEKNDEFLFTFNVEVGFSCLNSDDDFVLTIPSLETTEDLNVDFLKWETVNDDFEETKLGTLQTQAAFGTFLMALSSFPKQSIKRCPHCEKVFFNPTNLRKRYCSTKCQKIASAYRSIDKKKSLRQETTE